MIQLGVPVAKIDFTYVLGERTFVRMPYERKKHHWPAT